MRKRAKRRRTYRGDIVQIEGTIFSSHMLNWWTVRYQGGFMVEEKEYINLLQQALTIPADVRNYLVDNKR